jgi:hypothetical protein
MSISPEAVSAIQRAGQAIHEAQQSLATETSAHASRVAQALSSDAFGAENDAYFVHWKSVARMAQSMLAIEEQLKQMFFSAGEIAMNGNGSTSRSRKPLQLAATHVIDAVDVTPQRAPRQLKKKQKRVMRARASATAQPGVLPSRRSQVSNSGLKGNAGRVLDFLQTKIGKDAFGRVTHAEIASGAPVPTGSVGAAISALVSKGMLVEGSRGEYRLA